MPDEITLRNVTVNHADGRPAEVFEELHLPERLLLTPWICVVIGGGAAEVELADGRTLTTEDPESVAALDDWGGEAT
jgi:hypothetical protein